MTLLFLISLSLSIILPNQSDLSSIQSDITQSTYNLLTRVHTWPAFSNHTPGDGGSSSNSLEAIHDEIHGTIGGQMGDPAVAGTSSRVTASPSVPGY
jgi:Common central domain of tyrosinase